MEHRPRTQNRRAELLPLFSDVCAVPGVGAVGGEGPGARRSADAADGVRGLLVSWVPRCVRSEPAEVAAEVMPPARRMVAAAGPATRHDFGRMMRAVAEYLLWARARGDSLETPAVLDPDRAEFFVTRVNGHRGLAWQQDARRSLRQVGRVVNPRDWPAEPKRLGSARTAAPYSADEQRAWLLDAALRCRSGSPGEAWVVCASLGAGLSGPEIAAASPGDVVGLDDGARVGVRVGGRNARLVPLRAAFGGLALEACRTARGGRFVAAAGPNAVHKTAARVVVEGLGSLSYRRSRSSWLAAHLAAGTPLAALRAIAGPLSTRTLDDLLEASGGTLTPEEAAAQGLGP